MKKIIYFFIVILIAGVTLDGCKQLTDIATSLTNLKKLQFKLKNVTDMSLSGVKLSKLSKVNDMSIQDGLKLTQAFAAKKLPAQFTLNVLATNPNTGKSGIPKTNSTLSSLDWKLYIDDTETVAGDIKSPVQVPGTGSAVNIPLGVNLDLYKFFGSQSYDKLINLALAIGGSGSSPSRLKLDARPKVETPFGPIVYPGRITIVDKEWR